MECFFGLQNLNKTGQRERAGMSESLIVNHYYEIRKYVIN